MTVTVNTVNVQGAGVQTTGDDREWSIDELAAVVGVPTRTIREYRTLGVLAAPRKVGRSVVYDDAHRRRLELIGRLQTRGYSLAGMRDLFDAWDRGESLEDVLEGGLDEGGAMLNDGELAERCPVLADHAVRRRAVSVGVLTAAGDERWCVRAPSLLDLLADAVDAGADVFAVLDAIADLRAGARRGARALAEVFVEEIWSTADPEAGERFARRARVRVARGAAAVFVDELGAALQVCVEEHPELAGLIERVSIGTGRVLADQNGAGR